ncbi:hypothetical protein INT48_004174 [Thamnidium elegans]|uniref:Uncharacterized protein n=1 Tax=Thamnidium elegans TaxID=101142 RepID=A0A8H7SUP2_9FUNG|nr:hypothetical protein INT48_004174 [Thamnidium elegans]
MKSKHASTPNTSIITLTTLSQTTISSSLSAYDNEDDDYVLDDIGMESNSDIMEEMCTPINILEESSALSTNAMNLDEDYNWQPDTINSSKIDFNHHHRSHLTENPHYGFLYRAPLLRERYLNIL